MTSHLLQCVRLSRISHSHAREHNLYLSCLLTETLLDIEIPAVPR
jgi:hypothetical protein